MQSLARLAGPCALFACVAGAAAAQAALPRLAGTVVGNGERRAVLVAPDGSFDSVAEGGQLGGVQVIRIMPGTVWVRSSGGTVVLNLVEDPGTRATIVALHQQQQGPPQLSEAERQADEDNNR